MSISLSDLPTAVADYVKNNVTVEVSEVKHGISSVLQPHEKGTFNVTVTNKGNVRLTDLVYELSVSKPKVAKLISPAGFPTFALDDIGGDPIGGGDETNRMFVGNSLAVGWNTLEAGATVTSPDWEVKTQAELGDATIKCVLHATVDQASLFPADQEGTPSTSKLTVS